MKVHYPKLYNMAHLLASNVLLLPKDLTIIFIIKCQNVETTLGGRKCFFRPQGLCVVGSVVCYTYFPFSDCPD